MGMRKFWGVALPFSKVACVVKDVSILYLAILLIFFTYYSNNNILDLYL
jgi:hypothetical protein